MRGTTTIWGPWLEWREGCRCHIPCSFSHELTLGVPEVMVVAECIVVGSNVVVGPLQMLEIVLDTMG